MTRILPRASAFGALLAALVLPALGGASASDLVFKPSESVAPPFHWTGPYIVADAGFGDDYTVKGTAGIRYKW